MNLLLSLHEKYSTWILTANRNALQFQHVSLTTSLSARDVQKAFLPPAPVQRNALLPMQICKTINILCTKHTVIRNIYSDNEKHQLFSVFLNTSSTLSGNWFILTFSASWTSAVPGLLFQHGQWEREALVLKCHHTVGNSGVWDDTVNKLRSVWLHRRTGVMADMKMLQCSVIKLLHLVQRNQAVPLPLTLFHCIYCQ